MFRAAGRWDLVNKLYQTTNNWKLALEIGQKEDRIHRRNTHYAYAQHLEPIGAIDSAINQFVSSSYLFIYCSFETSETHRFEVPRMLFDDPVVLEQYVKKKKDKLAFTMLP